MKKVICRVMLTLFMLCPMLSISVSAEEQDKMSFSFDLTVDGKDLREVRNGDIITVVLRLQRTDAEKPYTMYGMQSEIRYDSTFFELVEDSIILSEGIVSTDIAMVDQYRECYMNYVSMNGGIQWDTNKLIGSIQLKVIGDSGVTRISCEDYMVSVMDGSGSHDCEAGEITIILSTDCKVSFQSNGGSKVEDQVISIGERISPPEEPIKEGYYLEGWYTDIHLTERWDFEEDTVKGNMFLYAKWMEKASVDTDQIQGGEKRNCIWWLLLLIIILIIVIIGYMKRQRGKEREASRR